MKMTSFTTPLAVLALFTLASAPAFAQERAQGRRDRSAQGERTGERAQPRSEAQPRQGATAPRAEAQREASAPAPRAEAQRQAAVPHDNATRESARAPLANRPGVAGQAVPRRDVIAPRGNVSRDHYPYSYRDGRYYDRGRYSYRPRYVPAPRYYVRPYAFRPRFSIGFGIFAGYPVPYTYSYPYPIAVYGYRAPRAPVIVSPGSPYYGGVALEINPPDAEVYVDGGYAGYAGDFDGSRQPLTLTAGTHRVEVQAQGYAPLIIDVQVQPGQVVPYRGDMQPY
jgi:hypothetical protein